MSQLFTHTKGRVENSLGYLSWQFIAGAVLDVFIENQRDETRIKASADSWAIVDELRQQIHKRACKKWCDRTGLDSTFFPFNVDAVARLYFKYRKRNAQEVAAFMQEISTADAGKVKDFE